MPVTRTNSQSSTTRMNGRTNSSSNIRVCKQSRKKSHKLERNRSLTTSNHQFNSSKLWKSKAHCFKPQTRVHKSKHPVLLPGKNQTSHILNRDKAMEKHHNKRASRISAKQSKSLQLLHLRSISMGLRKRKLQTQRLKLMQSKQYPKIHAMNSHRQALRKQLNHQLKA